MIAETKHAFVIVKDEGVELNGEGFRVMVKGNQTVKFAGNRVERANTAVIRCRN